MTIDQILPKILPCPLMREVKISKGGSAKRNAGGGQ